MKLVTETSNPFLTTGHKLTALATRVICEGAGISNALKRELH
jgi:hypothetical protein